ncbi:NADH-quinone oxidoreductase subunit N [Pilimelia anulata]|uniref:NADH-quinone oxidoreductase subunit N n=1 Tax=Pilimelia anulata TaxID=53371 RepID=A0A8J3B674_9ACTN|nr:proton-conducting transporter membrane subunit [Pilimelia anulata]GGJ98360.1 NADH-quinone oxidoreductase subunit N [Pilimelia anulata]
MTFDHAALLPAYLAAGTALLVLLADLVFARRGAVLGTAALGALATGVGAAVVGAGGTRETLCAAGGCAYRATGYAAVVAALFAALTLGVLALAAPLLREPDVPAGEWCFLLAASMTGGVVLGYAADLVTLLVAVETLTLPLYPLVALRARRRAAGAAVTYYVVSVVASAVSLLGAALLYAATGRLHLAALAAGPAADTRLAAVGTVLLLVGLAVKVAAVPVHAWAPAVYDGAALPVTAYLSTAAKVGGAVALLALWRGPLPGQWTGPALAVVAAVTMTAGNLAALRQRRIVRLLAWSSVAQLGYVLAPLAVVLSAGQRDGAAVRAAGAAALAYLVFFVLIEFGAFAALVALRGAAGDGGTIESYRGAARDRPLAGAALALALVGLAGLPPGLAGLFAKITATRAVLAGDLPWLALLIAANTVLALAYYLRPATALYRRGGTFVGFAGRPWSVTAGLGAATAAAVLVGFAPQWVLDLAALPW